MKLAMVGTGMIVNDCFRFFHEIEGLDVVCIVSTPRSEDKAKELCEKHNVKKYYTDVNEMLQDDEVEVVYVGVPNHLHYDVCKKALHANKHVICEKPFTSNYKEMVELVELAREKHLMMFEAVSTHYLPNLLKIKEVLPELGNIKIASANYSQYSSRYDAFKEGTILPAFDYTKSGGALMDLNIYNINFMVALFGAPKHVNYQANIEKGIDTSGILTLDYGNFKAVCIAAKDCKAPVMTSIQGDKGCVVIDTPVNTLDGFKVLMNKPGSKRMDDAGEEKQNYNLSKHRMYHEFVKFEELYRTKDYDFMNKMLDVSLITMDIQTKARETAGVRFTADE